MADVKRPVSTGFWTDRKVDGFSPEDRYFMLYLLTSPFSRQLGIYEISIRQSAFQMGYSEECFKVLLDRFENKYKMILYSKETSEVAILNFLCHSVVSGGKPVEDCIKQDMARVKDKGLIQKVFSHVRRRSDWDDLNATVKKIVSDYIKQNDIHNDDDNDNDNDSTGDDSFHDSSNDSPSSPPKIDPPKKPTKAEIDAFFDSIWNLYPVKKGKGQVSDTKRKELYKIGFDELERAIDRYLQELKKDADWRKPQNGSTFFNSGHVDYLDKNFVPQEVQERPVKQGYHKQTKADELNDFYAMAAQFGEGD